MSFFDQTKASLASKVVIGPNTGPMVVAGAYSHPAIHLLTNYYPDHNDNFLSLAPINDNALNLFVRRNKFGCDAIPHNTVSGFVQEIMNGEQPINIKRRHQ